MEWKQIMTLIISLWLLTLYIRFSDRQDAHDGSAFRAAMEQTYNIKASTTAEEKHEFCPPGTSNITYEARAIAAKMEEFSPAFSEFEDFPEYTGCQDAYQKGVRKSGVYPISLVGQRPFRAWCDFDGSGGWMVIQRRVDGTVDFYKKWTEYEQGFGNLCGEYWLGLNKISQMTRSAPALSVYMEAFDGDSGFANYSRFSVGDASTKYTLTVSSHSGSIPDGLFAGNGQKFTTWDQDNDDYILNCAEKYLGAWWHKACFSSNLNGRYEKGHTDSKGTSNCWNGFKGYYYGLKVSIMRIQA